MRFFKRLKRGWQRLLNRLRGRPDHDWLETYNTEAADIDDDLMDLNNTRR